MIKNWELYEQQIAHRIKNSKTEGHYEHLDTAPWGVEYLRNQPITSLRDGASGVVETVDNWDRAHVRWMDEASCRANSGIREIRFQGKGKRTKRESVLAGIALREDPEWVIATRDQVEARYPGLHHSIARVHTTSRILEFAEDGGEIVPAREPAPRHSLNPTAFVHTLSDLLRSYYRPSDYPSVILPLLIIRRLNQFDFEAARRLQPKKAAERLSAYLAQSRDDQEILALMDFEAQISRLVHHQGALLPLLLAHFAKICPDDNEGRLICEEVSRQFVQIEGGAYFTPPDLVELLTGLLLDGQTKGYYSLYDPCCGLGGMLFSAADYLPGCFELYGQECDPLSAAIAKVGLRLRRGDPAAIKIGDTLAKDEFSGRKFDLVIANPPWGVRWKRVEQAVRADPRFSAGKPKISDSTMLFIQHCLHKINEEGRVAILTNGSPLFSGQAGSGESEIRRWLIENDWLEAVISLPEGLFYNTSIASYVWVLTKKKRPERRGLIQLVNATELGEPMRRNEGKKSQRLKAQEALALYRAFEAGADCKILPARAFGYQHVKTWDPECGNDTENVPLETTIEDYMAKWVWPHAPRTVTKGTPVVGYEINVQRYFYRYKPLRSVEEIMADINDLEAEIQKLVPLVIGVPAEPLESALPV